MNVGSLDFEPLVFLEQPNLLLSGNETWHTAEPDLSRPSVICGLTAVDHHGRWINGEPALQGCRLLLARRPGFR